MSAALVKRHLTDAEEAAKTLRPSREAAMVKTKLDEVRMWLRDYFERVECDPTIGVDLAEPGSDKTTVQFLK